MLTTEDSGLHYHFAGTLITIIFLQEFTMKKITARFTTLSISPEIEPTREGVKKNYI